MSDTNELVEGYVAMWNEADPSARSAAADRVWEPDATYVDPLGYSTSREQIEAAVAAVQEQFPGLRFRRLGEAEAHHDVVRFRWQLGTEAEPDMVIGADVALVAESGRFAAVYGFLDKVPPALA